MTKNCPFCASADLQVIDEPTIFVCCNDCGAEGPYHRHDIDLAIEYWDTRPPAGSARIEMDKGDDD